MKLLIALAVLLLSCAIVAFIIEGICVSANKFNLKRVTCRHTDESCKHIDELPELRRTVKLRAFIKNCCGHCRHYDGYDTCMHREHWGAVCQNTVEWCKKNKDYES